MFRGLFLFLFVILFSNQVFAIGFGQASLHSHLGEPLDVRVPLILAEGENIRAIDIRLASPSEYKNLEQRLPHAYQYIRTDIRDFKAASPEIIISSSAAIDESILVLVLKVKRGRGNFYKKMQFFLDAADIKPTRHTAWVNKADASQVKFTPPADNQHSTVSSTPIAAPVMSGWARRSSYGPVQYGDSLSEIAYRLRRDKRWSNRQVMLALFDKNPDAFVEQNINQLRKGSFLTVPDDAEMQSFVGSQRYQELKPVLLKNKGKKKGKKAAKRLAPKKEVARADVAPKTPRYRGKISLGLDESLVPAPANPEVLKRLDKLEPMYQQAMAASLRMDGIGGKVDALADEVSKLHQKIDALALKQQTAVKDETSYGFISFMLLLLLNIIGLLAYFYRKQMKEWQVKLMDAQRQFSEKKQAGVEVSAAYSDAIKAEESFKRNVEEAPEPHDVMSDTSQEGFPDLDVPLDGEGSVVESQEDVADLPVSSDEQAVDHVAKFEEMVHKKAWILADEHYEKMSDEDKNRPRVQALLVQKMHRSGDVIARNVTLLNLSRLYEPDQWHRFCSYFDHDVWQEMQDEKVISFTGKVSESEMDKMNSEQDESLKDGADASVIDYSDTDSFGFVVEPTEDEVNLDKLRLNDDVPQEKDMILDMGSVDQEEVEPIVDILEDTPLPSGYFSTTAQDYDDLLDPTVIRDSEKHKEMKAKLLKKLEAESEAFDFSLELDTNPSEEQALGEADTVIVTPEMLAEVEKAKGNQTD